MSLAEDVLDLLSRRAQRAGFEPWLLAPAGRDWRWWSWEESRSVVERLRKLLETVGLRAGEPVALPAPVGPASVAAALATALAGGEPIGPSATPAAAVRIEVAGSRPAAGDASSLCFRVEIVGPRTSPASPIAAKSERPSASPVGELSAGSSPRATVVRSGRAWGGADLELLHWSVRTEAAILLEPAMEAFGATVHWARPTHLVEPGSGLSALAVRLRSLAGGRDPEAKLRRRLDRLRRVWWLGSPPEEAATALYQRLGASVEPWRFTDVASVAADGTPVRA